MALKTNLWQRLPTLSRRSFVRSCQEEFTQTFQGARVGKFRQESPRHEHAWRSDSVLRAFLRRTIPMEVLEGSSSSLLSLFLTPGAGGLGDRLGQIWTNLNRHYRGIFPTVRM